MKVLFIDDSDNVKVMSNKDIMSDDYIRDIFFTPCGGCGKGFLKGHTNTDGYCIKCAELIYKESKVDI